MTPPAIDIGRSGDRLEVRLSGDWVQGQKPPTVEPLLKVLDEPGPTRELAFDSRALDSWDSRLLTWLLKLEAACLARNIALNGEGLPEGVRGLLALAHAVPERAGARREIKKVGVVELLGRQALALRDDALAITAFIGENILAWLRFFTGRARYRKSDFWIFVQDCGAQALPIVTLISLLVGMILAFVGAVQLRMFGAQVYIADLVGLGMSREMGAMMTGIIMAGRTGAAYAAQLGSMQVNSEIDALKTLGLAPMDFLVLPRMLALILMMPLLCLYADLMGILGGALVSVGMFDITPLEYFIHTRERLDLDDFAIGVFKCAVFGVLVASAGCMRGMQCGRSASAVGDAATSAVVTGIVFIVVSDALITLIITALKI
ncbi:ABC transporter permease [Methylococcus sp. EFPC2]|uniref:MlaE family ABC transporter permease n=1 Tax=Methylococcus sp. EFPC2 TaxID=2812648 RepID=UPI00196742C4|nr:ABC transporter permease [Methylococcus sp. EFPC2]QSA95481.1 ABC transporter permease [Methylococcus sp. EFPC2]